MRFFDMFFALLDQKRELDCRSSLQVEQLEDRVMLSTIQVIAAGTTGDEEIQLQIDNAVVETWNDLGSGADSGTFVTRDYTSAQNITASQIRINFTNDLWDPANNIDRNVRVDAIVIDGTRYETEDPSVFSNSTWIQNVGFVPGNHESEYLHGSGYFQFSGGAPGNGSEIRIRAGGDEGGEQFNLRIDGQTVANWTATTNNQTFTYTSNSTVTADQIRIEFTNDLWEPGVTDRNLIVDYISIDGVTFQTEDPSVYSTGTWLPADGIVPGFRENERLHTNGYFQYADLEIDTRALPDAEVVTFAAFGDYGTETGGTPDVSNLVNQLEPDIIVTTGDARYGSGEDYAGVHSFYTDYLHDAQPSSEIPGGGTSSINRFFPAPGNHDHDDAGGIDQFTDFFNLPGDDVPTESNTGSELFYDFVWGPVHFFVIDSNSFIYDSASRTAQTAWLQSELQDSASPWQVVVMHHSAYSSSAAHGSNPIMQLDYALWGADLVLSGHDHTYERLQRDDITYVVTGLGGKSTYNFGTIETGSVARYADDYGINMFTATSTEITGSFISIDGVTQDQFVIAAN